MKKPLIHFAHANGFPARTYRKLFSELENDYRIGYIERHAHDPRFPVRDGWIELKNELREYIREHYDRKIIGVGHSLGGILHFLNAVENPELYERLILLDAPLVSRLSGAAVKMLKTTGLMRRAPLPKQTVFRRNFWSSRSEALDHFRRKEKFGAFDPDVLADYVEFGMIDNSNGVKLWFEPKIESKIYRTLPHDFGKFKGKLKVPTDYVGGTASREARLAGLGFMKRNFPVRFHFLSGTHLFPFEKPLETARLIKIILESQPAEKR